MEHPPLVARRQLIQGLGAGALAALLPRAAAAGSKKKVKITGISFGCAAITWGDAQAPDAIREIGEAGYRGIQLRVDGLKAFATPAALRAALAKAKLALPCLSGGAPDPDPAKRAAEIDRFMPGVEFAKAAGARIIQVTSPARPAGGVAAVAPVVLQNYAATISAIGKRVSELGLTLGFHPQVNQYGGRLEEIDTILAAADARHVKLLLDTGHHAAAGGDPAQMIRAHKKRLCMVHLKDVEDAPPAAGGEPYRFVELGEGKVDFPAVFAALGEIKYRGWAVVEMRPERVRDGHSAKDMAIANRAYLEKTFAVKL